MGWSGGGQIFGYIWLGQKLQKLKNVKNNQSDIEILKYISKAFYNSNVYITLFSCLDQEVPL